MFCPRGEFHPSENSAFAVSHRPPRTMRMRRRRCRDSWLLNVIILCLDFGWTWLEFLQRVHWLRDVFLATLVQLWRKNWNWKYENWMENLHFFPKYSTLISGENCWFFWGGKSRENVVVLDFLAVDNFDFTRKKLRFFLGWKTRENVGVLDFLAIDNFDFTRKIVKKIWVKLEF